MRKLVPGLVESKRDIAVDQLTYFSWHVRDTQIKIKAMAVLDKLSLTELEDLAAKLRHTIARNPSDSRMEQVELEDVKQWIVIRQNRENS